MNKMFFGLLCLFAASACAGTGTEINERADADANGHVVVSNVAGEIIITGWKKNEVTVTGTLGRGAERLEFVPSGDHTLIKVIVPRKSRNVKDTNLDINVPEGSSLKVSGVSSDIIVSNVHGSLRVHTVSGDLDIEAHKEDIEAKTVSGDIEVRGQDAKAITTLNAVSGDIVVTNIGGELAITTVSGDIEARADDLSRLALQTTTGNIQIESAFDAGARAEIETINGGVDLTIHGNRDGEYEVETFNGSIDNCFGPEPERTSKYAPGRALIFDEGDSETRYRIKTLNGSVDICDH